MTANISNVPQVISLTVPVLCIDGYELSSSHSSTSLSTSIQAIQHSFSLIKQCHSLLLTSQDIIGDLISYDVCQPVIQQFYQFYHIITPFRDELDTCLSLYDAPSLINNDSINTTIKITNVGTKTTTNDNVTVINSTNIIPTLSSAIYNHCIEECLLIIQKIKLLTNLKCASRYDFDSPISTLNNEKSVPIGCFGEKLIAMNNNNDSNNNNNSNEEITINDCIVLTHTTVATMATHIQKLSQYLSQINATISQLQSILVQTSTCSTNIISNNINNHIDISNTNHSAYYQEIKKCLFQNTLLAQSIQPFLTTISNLYLSYIHDLCYLYKSTSKFLYINLRIFRVLLAKGLCADKINDGGTGDGDGSGSGNIADMIFQDNIEGTGMGEGQGKKDVSNELQNEDQIMGLKDENDPENDPDKETQKNQKEPKKLNEKEEDNAIEMSQDFDGELYDMPEDDDNDNNDDDNDDGMDQNDLEREIGQTDTDDIIDEKQWDDNDEDDDNNKKDQFEKNSKMKGGPSEDEMRTRDEDEETSDNEKDSDKNDDKNKKNKKDPQSKKPNPSNDDNNDDDDDDEDNNIENNDNDSGDGNINEFDKDETREKPVGVNVQENEHENDDTADDDNNNDQEQQNPTEKLDEPKLPELDFNQPNQEQTKNDKSPDEKDNNDKDDHLDDFKGDEEEGKDKDNKDDGDNNNPSNNNTIDEKSPSEEGLNDDELPDNMQLDGDNNNDENDDDNINNNNENEKQDNQLDSDENNMNIPLDEEDNDNDNNNIDDDNEMTPPMAGSNGNIPEEVKPKDEEEKTNENEQQPPAALDKIKKPPSNPKQPNPVTYGLQSEDGQDNIYNDQNHENLSKEKDELSPDLPNTTQTPSSATTGQQQSQQGQHGPTTSQKQPDTNEQNNQSNAKEQKRKPKSTNEPPNPFNQQGDINDQWHRHLNLLEREIDNTNNNNDDEENIYNDNNNDEDDDNNNTQGKGLFEKTADDENYTEQMLDTKMNLQNDNDILIDDNQIQQQADTNNSNKDSSKQSMDDEEDDNNNDNNKSTSNNKEKSDISKTPNQTDQSNPSDNNNEKPKHDPNDAKNRKRKRKENDNSSSQRPKDSNNNEDEDEEINDNNNGSNEENDDYNKNDEVSNNDSTMEMPVSDDEEDDNDVDVDMSENNPSLLQNYNKIHTKDKFDFVSKGKDDQLISSSSDANNNSERSVVAWDMQQVENGRLLWSEHKQMTDAQSIKLTEQLRIILEPTIASRLKGDYRTGKRLNMRRIISYVASGFRKDKIWLRRTKPAKRNYQVMLMIDNSQSMSESGPLALSSLSLITTALTRLEIGEISLVAFDEFISILHPFNEPFNDETGAKCFSKLDFSSKKTMLGQSLESVIPIFTTAKDNNVNSNNSNMNTTILQICFIISDARIDSDNRHRIDGIIRSMAEKNILVLLVIIDKTVHKNDSIFNTKTVEFVGQKVITRGYLDDFPFPYYIAINDIYGLSDVLSEALKQWFELARNQLIGK